MVRTYSHRCPASPRGASMHSPDLKTKPQPKLQPKPQPKPQWLQIYRRKRARPGTVSNWRWVHIWKTRQRRESYGRPHSSHGSAAAGCLSETERRIRRLWLGYRRTRTPMSSLLDSGTSRQLDPFSRRERKFQVEHTSPKSPNYQNNFCFLLG